MPFVMDKSKSEKGSSVSDEFALFNQGLSIQEIVLDSTEVQWDISDFPFLQNKNYQY